MVAQIAMALILLVQKSSKLRLLIHSCVLILDPISYLLFLIFLVKYVLIQHQRENVH
jgi:hypothetical protein